MASKLQEMQVPLIFNGINLDIDPRNLKDGEFQQCQNFLYRDGEFQLRKGITNVEDFTFESMVPVKTFAYTTDRDADGDLNRTRWLVINDSDGKLWRSPEGSGNWTEIKLHGTTSFDVEVEEFFVINQDLIFHVGHADFLGSNVFIYGHRSINRVDYFESRAGWYCDRMVPDIIDDMNSYLDPTTFRSAYVDDVGSTDYIYFIQNLTIYKAEFNTSTQAIGNVLWQTRAGKQFKIVGVNRSDDEVYLFWGYYTLTSKIKVLNASTGELKEVVELDNQVSDVVWREYNTTGNWYFYGCNYTGGNNYVYQFNRDGSLHDSATITLNGSDEAYQIEVEYDGDGVIDMNLICVVGFDDSSDSGEFYIYTEASSLTLTEVATVSFGSETGTMIRTGSGSGNVDDGTSMFVSLVDRNGTLIRRSVQVWYAAGWDTSLNTDATGSSFEVIHPGVWQSQGWFLSPYGTLPNASLEWFDEDIVSQKEYRVDVIINTSAEGTGSTSGEFRYKYVIIFDDNERSPLSSYVKEQTGVSSHEYVQVRLHIRSDSELRRATHVEVYRSYRATSSNSWDEYKLLKSVDLTEEGGDVSDDGSGWQTGDSGTTYYITFYDYGDELTDTYFDLSDVDPDEDEISVQFKTAFYSNGRMFFGNLKTTDEIFNDRIGFSPLDAPSIQPKSNYLTLSKGDPDEVTSISYLDDVLLVGKKNSLYAYDISSYLPQEWFEVMVKNNVGILSNNHIAVTPYGTVFMDAHSVYMFDKERGVRDIARNRVWSIVPSLVSNVEKVHYVPEEEVVWFLESASSTMYVYDLLNDAWYTEKHESFDTAWRPYSLYDVCTNKENNVTYVLYISYSGAYGYTKKIGSAYTNSGDESRGYLESKKYGIPNTLVRLREAWLDTDLSEYVFNIFVDGVQTQVSDTEYLAVSGSQQCELFSWKVEASYGGGANPGEAIRRILIRFLPSRLRKR